MFYYLFQPIMTYNIILIFAAVIPAIGLMIYVYKADHLEKESPAMLWRLVIGGVLSSLIALVAERVFSLLLNITVSSASAAYNIILYFIIVAFSEEGAKYFMLRRRSWRSPEFNCQYDGVVYAVFVSLGFAIWENISYVLSYGFATAIVRAVTAIPGHACFGVFMGVFYALAKRYSLSNQKELCTLFSVLAVVIPGLLHGTYDYIATKETSSLNWVFIVFVLILFAVSFLLIRKVSRADKFLNR